MPSDRPRHTGIPSSACPSWARGTRTLCVDSRSRRTAPVGVPTVSGRHTNGTRISEEEVSQGSYAGGDGSP
jgi:hypothetical protein